MNKKLISFKEYKLNFINNNFKIKINNVVRNFFPKLNSEDIEILIILTKFIINLISIKNNFTSIHYEQWMQNNNRDIKGVILLLLPFIDDKTNLFNKITDLNQLLYAYNKDIPKSILELPREEILSTHFEYGNMGIGLLQNKDILLQLNDEEKLIHKIMYHNLLGCIQTLDIINGKLYINWVNIIPLNINNYIESNIYKETKNKLLNFSSDFIKYENLSENFNYSGLWFGDLYNIIRINFYEDAKDIKWLIFPYEYERKIYLIHRLNEILNLDKILELSVNFNDLNDNDKIYFKNKVKSLSLVNSIDFEVIKNFLIFLINNYSKKNLLKNIDKFKIQQNDDKEDFDEKDYKIIQQIENIDIINCLKNLDVKDIWDYLKESLTKLKYSAYGKYIIKDNKINNKYYFEPLNSNDLNDKSEYENKLNLKNIYNIAKALSHNNFKDWVLLDKNYISLNKKNKTDFFDKIRRMKNHNKWINLNNNLERQFMYNYNYDNEMQNILIAFQNIFFKLVFEELVVSGILSKFVINTGITDKSKLPSDTDSRKNKIKDLLKEEFKKNKTEWLDSYYYLTNEKFSKLGKTRVDKKVVINPINKYDEYDYFDLITKDHEWFAFYAMDWISQISFFQHYIYHQVLYVTGATGQGKSTQVPKLLLYALKAIDYKSDGKVICTQPRITPTIDNASRIAEELGVPILQTCNTTTNKIQTNNYYIQYKYQGDEHTKNEKYSLKIVTDGTLYEEIKMNPTMFQKVNDKEINKNIYDIIIVDEAHEHNTNMDMIIALARQSCFFNNTIRLIIVSATMDDDEPIYRRYFSEINDNLLFPIKFPIFDILPQAVYMDRRYHISPPGETTQYRVDENYLDTEPEDAKKAQELGYRRIIDICNKTDKGEILFFCNGQADIVRALKYLNENLPVGNIALPYYSNLHENYKNIVTKIDIKINSIKNKRENIFSEWGETFIEDLTVQSGIYKRAVIIATNVAEASITIRSLKFVVDNGYAKVNFYAPDLNKTELIIDKISESSRLQRKGRVGRVGDGTVHYMYKKNGRIDIKPKYKITQQEIFTVILGLLYNKTIDDIKNNIIEKDNPKLLLPYILKKIFKKETKLIDIYNTNYRINDSEIPNDYYYNITNPFPLSYYIVDNKQIIENLLDTQGIFYLIHPFENYIKRNVLNNIINYNNKKSNVIPIIFYKYIFNYLINKNLITSSKYTNYSDMNERNRYFYKTELVDKVLDVSKNFGTDINNSITLLAASAMNCFDEVYKIIILLELLNNNMKTLIHPNIKWFKFKEIYKENNDIIFLYKFIQKIEKKFNNLIKINYDYDKIHKDFIIELKFKEPKNFDGILWNKLIHLKNNDILDYDKVIKNNFTFDNEIEKYNDKIEYWAENNFFNPDIIKNYFLRINKIDIELVKKIKEDKMDTNFLKYLIDNTMEEKIVRSFIYGSPIQFTYTTNREPISWMNFKNYKVNFTETLTNLSNNLVYYFNYKKTNSTSKDEEIEIKEVNKVFTEIDASILCPVNIQWLIAACPQIINPTFDIDKNINYGIQEEIVNINYFTSSDLQRIKRDINNNWGKYNLWNNMPILNYS